MRSFGLLECQEESKKDEAAYWPDKSLPSVTTATMTQRLGHSAGRKLDRTDCTLPPAPPRHLFFPAHADLPFSGSFSHQSLGSPHIPIRHDTFTFRPFAHSVPAWKALGPFPGPSVISHLILNIGITLGSLSISSKTGLTVSLIHLTPWTLTACLFIPSRH